MAAVDIETRPGRHGLVIPVVETGRATRKSLKALNFFRELWSLNGFGDVEGWQHARPTNHELVIPPSADKPLTVVRSSLVPLPESSRYELDPGEHVSAHSRSTALETHEVLTPPGKIGPFAVTFSIYHTHTEGMQVLSWPEPTAIEGGLQAAAALLSE